MALLDVNNASVSCASPNGDCLLLTRILLENERQFALCSKRLRSHFSLNSQVFKTVYGNHLKRARLWKFERFICPFYWRDLRI